MEDLNFYYASYSRYVPALDHSPIQATHVPRLTNTSAYTTMSSHYGKARATCASNTSTPTRLPQFADPNTSVPGRSSPFHMRSRSP